MYSIGDILLIAFPFTSGGTSKKRPALVLLDTGDADVLVARITSQISNSEYDIIIDEWQNAGLLVPSYIRLHKLATLEKVLIDKKLGELSALDLEKVREKLTEIFGISN
jgi:mRNA interferase MazF